ncbi:MAG: ArnT family glycosyltransferase [Planctomycetota bacterium]
MSPVEIESSFRTSRRGRIAAAAVLVGLVLGAFALRIWALRLRGVVDYDETYYYILGRSLVSGNGYKLNGLPHTAFPPLYPLLVGLASFFTDRIRPATSIISGIFGAALVLPVYFLARLFYDRATSLVASVFTATWPALFFFAARSVPYSQRLYAGSEPLFVTLFAAGVFFLAATARFGGVGRAAAAGIFFGAAALTRNETALLAVFAGVWFVVAAARSGFLKRRKVVLLSSIVAAGFLAAVAPFLIYVYRASGRASMGAKLSNLAHTRPALRQWISNDNAEDYVAIHYRLNDEATQMADPYWGISDRHRRTARDSGGIRACLALASSPDFTWVKAFVRSFFGGTLSLVPLYVWPFVLWGFIRALLAPGQRGLAGLLAALAAAHIAQAVFVYTIGRFQLTLLVPLALLAASGAWDSGRLISRGVSALTGKGSGCPALLRPVPAMIFAAMMCYTGVRANISGGADRPVKGAVSSTGYDRHLADRLRDLLPSGATLMCNKPWIAVWAGLDWRVSPSDTPERILKYALNRRIEYALLGRWQIGGPEAGTALHPYLIDTLDGGDFVFRFTGEPVQEAAR